MPKLIHGVPKRLNTLVALVQHKAIIATGRIVELGLGAYAVRVTWDDDEPDSWIDVRDLYREEKKRS